MLLHAWAGVHHLLHGFTLAHLWAVVDQRLQVPLRHRYWANIEKVVAPGAGFPLRVLICGGDWPSDWPSLASDCLAGVSIPGCISLWRFHSGPCSWYGHSWHGLGFVAGLGRDFALLFGFWLFICGPGW